MRSLEEEIARLCRPDVFRNADLAVKWEALDRPPHLPWFSAGMSVRLREVQEVYATTSAILSLLRDRLLSDEAVEAGARTVDPLPWSDNWSNMPQTRADRKAVSIDKARACLSAALDRIESHDR
ncbi:hypothetical protein [Caulobacter phage KcrB]|nr:hypothetical protein RW_GP035 [Caulobacter phage RW]WCA46339.1 hypothetical protein [Caulobacter phage KcrB]WCD56274.1 hypothetical protein [Caulobacter phage RLK]WNV48066.1 hypothetical protein GB2A_gp034 [Caulobacter phage GB2A]